MAAILDIYLVRHAIAAEPGPKYADDRKRPLTPEGIKRFEEAVAGLVAFDVELDVILTSPLTRAEETATLLAIGLKKRAPIEELEALAPGGKFAAIVEAVSKQARRHRRRIALVGHEPDLGETAARWLGARGQVAFRKGAVCALEVDSATPAGPATLHWLLPPRVLRRLAP
jgi:phosphohistidine phosphatase